MLFQQPVAIYFAVDQPGAAQVQRGLTARRSSLQIRFGGYEAMRVGQKAVSNPSPPPGSQVCTIMVQSSEDMRIVSEALASHGRKAWVNVMTTRGPVSMALPEFLQQHGLH